MLSKNIVDHSDGRYDEIVNFAKKHPKGESFTQCIERLGNIANNYPDSRCVIYDDHAQMSLYFNIRTKTNEHVLNGGIIFHGSHDGFGSGAAPTFSVTMNDTNGWSMHT